jgi:hypothetical protein
VCCLSVPAETGALRVYTGSMQPHPLSAAAAADKLAIAFCHAGTGGGRSREGG